jgi:DNA-binding transcriptional regulator YdaS (Cro superfamily)
MKPDQVEPVLTEIARAIEVSGGPSRVAAALGFSTQTVCFWRDGKRIFKAEHGAALEALTEGQVTRKQIWPTKYSRIWPELAANDPAPTTEVAQHAN